MSSRKQLEQAFELIQQDQFADARAMLQPILDAEPDNADAWWLMANTVEDPRQARRALVNVLKNDPNHFKAREMLDVVNERFPARDDELEMLMELEDQLEDETDFWETQEEPLSDDDLFDLFDEEAAVDLSGLDDDLEAVGPSDTQDELEELEADDPFAELLGETAVAEAPPEEKKRRRWTLPVLVVLLAAVVATGLLALQQDSDDTSTDTGKSDLAPLVVVEDQDLSDLVDQTNAAAQQQFGDNSGAVIAPTDPDQTPTLFVRTCVCVQPGCQGPSINEMSAIVIEGFLVAAQQVSDEVARVGVDVHVCGGEDVLFRSYSSLSDVNVYRTGRDMETFEASWTLVTN